MSALLCALSYLEMAKEIMWECPFICLSSPCLTWPSCMIAYEEGYPVKQGALNCN
jgi:hypothetical protein